MKRSFPYLHFRGCTLILVSLLAAAGCGKKAEHPSSSGAEPQRASSRRSLQPELGSLHDLLKKRGPDGAEAKPSEKTLSESITNRHDWILRALERGYEKSGHENAKWDTAAHQAMRAYADYSRLATTDGHFTDLSNAVAAATAAGCDDPLIAYMRLRYGLGPSTGSTLEFAAAYLQVFRQVYLSQYHPLFKFYAGYNATKSAREADRNANRSVLLRLVTETLGDTAADIHAPSGEVFDAAFMWIEYTKARGWTDFVMTNIESGLKANWGNTEPYYRLQGAAEIHRAWDDRGEGVADSVTQKGWEGFTEHLENAERYLTKAWHLDSRNPSTAYYMMKVELGQGQGRPRMEKWFQRAMALDPSYYEAALLMSYYLEPRWYGSEQETLEFARTCATSTNWFGRVPLVLPQTHHSLAAYYKSQNSRAYWRQPHVWEDIRDGYEKFFKLNPDEVSWHHSYAMDAYRCGRLGVFLEQTKQFSSGTNYTFFGGRQKFEKMLAEASAHGAR